MAFPFVESNSASRQRLKALVRGLSDEDLACTNADGWTVASLLAHLAFWDQRVLVLLRRWKEKGVYESPVDAHATNDALRPLCLALNARTAIELCLSSAEAVDAELASITPGLVEQIQASPTHFRFDRGIHRHEHLEAIEVLLQTPRNPIGA